MAISLSSLVRENEVKAPRILIHGVSGVGKTTFASEANAPVFLQTEDGLGTLNVAHFPLARTWDEVLEALTALYKEAHDYRTLVIDSVDWLEPLIWARTCKDNGWASIEDAGFGKGYVSALAYWRRYVDALNALRDERGMTIIQIAHTDINQAVRIARGRALRPVRGQAPCKSVGAPAGALRRGSLCELSRQQPSGSHQEDPQ